MDLTLINQTALARKVGVTSEYVRLIFRGERKGERILPRIATSLGVELSWLKRQLPIRHVRKKHPTHQHRSKSVSPIGASINVRKLNKQIKKSA
jgi:hypothetical protein